MNNLQTIVHTVLEKQRLQLATSTYDVRKHYLKQLLTFATDAGITEPCQELYDSFVSRATTPDLRFQLFHAVRLVDKEAGTKSLTPEGKLYNEPEFPPSAESEVIFHRISFPIPDGSIDTGHLIHKSKHEMEYLQLSSSTNWQYMQAWQELYIFLYLRGDTIFTREGCTAFIESSIQKCNAHIHHEWKRKIQCRATNVLLEVADSGQFQWKQFTSRKTFCQEETLEDLRKQYVAYLNAQNLERKTVALYDYSFRNLIEGLGISAVSDFADLKPKQVQDMLVFLSEKLSLNSRGTIFPIIRQILFYVYSAGFTSVDFSGMILTPAYKRIHLKPYLNSSNEEKLYRAMNDASLRNKAMMRLALRLGLRDADICNLRFSQIDWKNDRITLEQEKTGVILVLPLLEDVGNAIMDYILNERPKAAVKCPYVFVRKQAPFKKLESMYSVCAKLFDKAGVKTENRESRGIHVCRYTLTHKLLLKKVPHQVITDTLGHVSKESDKPYLSMEEKMLRECPLSFTLIGQKYWEEGEAYD